MSAWYSIVRHVPDPIAEEFINVAVIVGGGTGGGIRVTTDMRRVSTFAKRTVGDDLDAFLEEVGAAPTATQLESMARHYQGSFRVTAPSPAAMEPGPCLEMLARRLLRSGGGADEAFVTVSRIAVRDRVFTELRRLPEHGRTRVPDFEPSIAGHAGLRAFDYAVKRPGDVAGDGMTPVRIVHALSFQTREVDRVSDAADQLSFAFFDVRQRHPTVLGSVVVRPPPKATRHGDAAFEQALRGFKMIGLEVVQDETSAIVRLRERVADELAA